MSNAVRSPAPTSNQDPAYGELVPSRYNEDKAATCRSVSTAGASGGPGAGGDASQFPCTALDHVRKVCRVEIKFERDGIGNLSSGKGLQLSCNMNPRFSLYCPSHVILSLKNHP